MGSGDMSDDEASQSAGTKSKSMSQHLITYWQWDFICEAYVPISTLLPSRHPATQKNSRSSSSEKGPVY